MRLPLTRPRLRFLSNAVTVAGNIPDTVSSVKPASTVIVTAPYDMSGRADEAFCQDFAILFVRRSIQASAMANLHVFPGGIIDDSDLSSDWETLFDNAYNMPGCSERLQCEALAQPLGDLLPIAHHPSGQYLPSTDTPLSDIPELSIRLAAMREVFEETGVLLAVRSNNDALVNASTNQDRGVMAIGKRDPLASLSEVQVQGWRKLVHEDATRFISMMTELNIVPDVLSLERWARWVTPVVEKRRFDTFFYLYRLPYVPRLLLVDGSEITSAVWMTPRDAINKCDAGKFPLSPPTYYNTLELASFDSEQDLVAALKDPGVPRDLAPVCPRITTDMYGRRVGILPGDIGVDLTKLNVGKGLFGKDAKRILRVVAKDEQDDDDNDADAVNSDSQEGALLLSSTDRRLNTSLGRLDSASDDSSEKDKNNVSIGKRHPWQKKKKLHLLGQRFRWAGGEEGGVGSDEVVSLGSAPTMPTWYQRLSTYFTNTVQRIYPNLTVGVSDLDLAPTSASGTAVHGNESVLLRIVHLGEGRYAVLVGSLCGARDPISKSLILPLTNASKL